MTEDSEAYVEYQSRIDQSDREYRTWLETTEGQRVDRTASLVEDKAQSIEVKLLVEPDYIPSIDEMKLYYAHMFCGTDAAFKVSRIPVDYEAIDIKPEEVAVDVKEYSQEEKALAFTSYKKASNRLNAYVNDEEADGLSNIYESFDHDEWDEIQLKQHILVATHLYEKLDQNAKNELAIFVSQNLRFFYENGVPETNAVLSSTLLKDLSPQDDAVQIVGENIMNTVLELSQEADKNAEYDFWSNDFINELVTWNNEKLILEGIAHTQNSDKRDKFLSLVVGRHGLPMILNVIRDNMKKPERRDTSERLLLHLMGVDPESKARGDIDIESFFKAIDFEDSYVVEREARQKRVDDVDNDLSHYGVPTGGSVLEPGCAGGWLTGGLLEKGYNAYGIELIPEYVNKANQEYGNRFIQASWYDLDRVYQTNRTEANFQGAPEQFNAVVIRGRSARHTEEAKNAMLLFDNVDAVLVDGGVFEFDFADPEVGYQREQLNEYRSFLEKRLDYNPEWLQKHFWHRVGAPLGQDGEQHYINTFDPPESLVHEMAGSRGLKIVEVRREENYDNRGSDNLVYIAIKTSGQEREELIENSMQKLQVRSMSQWDMLNSNRDSIQYFSVGLATLRDPNVSSFPPRS